MSEEKVTPKFKVGDVIVGSDGHEREMLAVGDVTYFYRDLTTGVEFCTSIVLTDENWSLKPNEEPTTRDLTDEEKKIVSDIAEISRAFNRVSDFIKGL